MICTLEKDYTVEVLLTAVILLLVTKMVWSLKCRKPKKMRTVAVQGPATYTFVRGNLDARFQPLPDSACGVWPADTV